MKATQTPKALTSLLTLLLALGVVALLVGVYFRQPAPENTVLSISQSPAPGTVTPSALASASVPAPTPISQAIITPQATLPGRQSPQPTVAISSSPQPTVALAPTWTSQPQKTPLTSRPQSTTQPVQPQNTPEPQDPQPPTQPTLVATDPNPNPNPVGAATTLPQATKAPGGGTSPRQNPPPTALPAGDNTPTDPVRTVPGTGRDEPRATNTPAPLLPSGPNPGSNGGGHAGGDASISTPKPTAKLPPAPTKPPTPTIVSVKATPKPKPGQIVLPNGVIYGERKPNLPNRIVRIASPNIKLDTPVYEVYSPKGTWEVADYAAGHNYNSKNPGEGGNIVLAGHNNWRGEVFRYVVDLKPGNIIRVWTLDGKERRYTVQSVNKVLESGVSYAQRLKNAKVMDPTPSEQLTLITCWPYTTFTHRVIVVAKPSP